MQISTANLVETVETGLKPSRSMARRWQWANWFGEPILCLQQQQQQRATYCLSSIYRVHIAVNLQKLNIVESTSGLSPYSLHHVPSPTACHMNCWSTADASCAANQNMYLLLRSPHFQFLNFPTVGRAYFVLSSNIDGRKQGASWDHFGGFVLESPQQGYAVARPGAGRGRGGDPFKCVGELAGWVEWGWSSGRLSVLWKAPRIVSPI